MLKTLHLTGERARALTLFETDDLSDPVELVRLAGRDVRRFFEYGRFEGLNLSCSSLAGVSFRGARLTGTIMRPEQESEIRATGPAVFTDHAMLTVRPPYVAGLRDMRAMRGRMRAALRRGMIAVLDVGTAKTACFVLRVDLARLDLAAESAAHDALGAIRVVGAGVTRSRGVKLGEIVDLNEAEKAVRTALEKAEKMAGERVDQVIACVSGARPESVSCFGEVEVEGDFVTRRDIGRALAACDRPPPVEGREVIHAMPVNFTLDNGTNAAQPIGMAAHHLAVDMHMVSVTDAPLRALATCVRRCDLDLAGVVAAPYSAAMSAMVEDEKKFGAACVDLGAGSTNISIFLHNHLVHTESIRLGGNHITHDIASGLSMPQAAAERIKIFHGSTVACGLDARQMIEVPRLAEDHPADSRRIFRSALIAVIRPRVEEILQEARRALDAAGFMHLPGRRIVLTGGGAQLTGVEEVAQRILGRQVRIGRPLRLGGLPQATTGPEFAAAVGLAFHAARPHEELWDFEPVGSLSSRRRIAGAYRRVGSSGTSVR